MQNLFLVTLLVFTLMLAAVLIAVSSDGALSRKWAKVRVQIDENQRKGTPDRHEEDLEDNGAAGLIILGTLLLFVYLVLSKG